MEKIMQEQDLKVLDYIAKLREDAQRCLWEWTEQKAKEAFAEGPNISSEDLVAMCDERYNNPIKSFIDKLTRDHQSITNGEAIKPPALFEFMFEMQQSTETHPIRAQHYPGLNLNPEDAQRLYNTQLAKMAGVPAGNFPPNPYELQNALIDMATSPDQSGFGRMEVDKDGNQTFTPITREEFYDKTATESGGDQ